jgi:hypothetical protein
MSFFCEKKLFKRNLPAPAEGNAVISSYSRFEVDPYNKSAYTILFPCSIQIYGCPKGKSKWGDAKWYKCREMVINVAVLIFVNYEEEVIARRFATVTGHGITGW